MGRRQATNKDYTASSQPPPPKHSLRNSNSTAPIFQLPTDVWLHIFTHLLPYNAAATLAALGATCRHLLRLVDEHGWKFVFSDQFRLVPLERVERAYGKQRCSGKRGKWWFACNYASQLDGCWSNVALRAASMDVPSGESTVERKSVGGGRGRRFGADFAIPTLTLGTSWMVIGARSELFVYHARPPTSGGQAELVSRTRLDSRTQLQHYSTSTESTSTAKMKSGTDDPWQDITALEAINAEASLVAVGFANGCVQIVALVLVEAAGKVVKAEVKHHFASTRRQEVAGISIRKAMEKPSSSHSVLNGTNAVEECLVASLSKRGLLRIHKLEFHDQCARGAVQTWTWQVDSEGETTPLDDEANAAAGDSGTNTPRTRFRSAAFNNAPLALPDTSGATRAWSILLGSAADLRHGSSEERKWLAVGITAEHAVYVYPLDDSDGSVGLKEPFYVASTGQRTSVYAMATPPEGSSLPSFLLFAGFYDGIVRVYDTRQIQTDPKHEAESLDLNDLDEALPNSTPRLRRIIRELNPIAIFREDYNTDAIYSLSFGGTQADRLVVGGARFAQVRVFDVSSLAAYDVPLLSDGAGSGTVGLDWTAFAVPRLDSPQYGVVAEADRMVGVTDRKMWWLDFGAPLLKQGGEKTGTVAYFRHRDGVLCYSNPSRSQ